MKNTILLLLFLCSFFGCKKDPFDYRTKYLGDYNFVIQSQSWTLQSGCFDTTYSKNGKIDYGPDHNNLFVYFNDKIADVLTIYEDGTIGGNHNIGEFETTKKLTYYYNESHLSYNLRKCIIGEKK